MIAFRAISITFLLSLHSLSGQAWTGAYTEGNDAIKSSGGCSLCIPPDATRPTDTTKLRPLAVRYAECRGRAMAFAGDMRQSVWKFAPSLDRVTFMLSFAANLPPDYVAMWRDKEILLSSKFCELSEPDQRAEVAHQLGHAIDEELRPISGRTSDPQERVTAEIAAAGWATWILRDIQVPDDPVFTQATARGLDVAAIRGWVEGAKASRKLLAYRMDFQRALDKADQAKLSEFVEKYKNDDPEKLVAKAHQALASIKSGDPRTAQSDERKTLTKGAMLIVDRNSQTTLAEIPDSGTCSTRFMEFSFELPIIPGGGFNPILIGASSVDRMIRVRDGELLDKWDLVLSNRTTRHLQSISKPTQRFVNRVQLKEPERSPECSLIGGRTGSGTQNLTIGNVPVDHIDSITFYDSIDTAKSVLARQESMRADEQKRAAEAQNIAQKEIKTFRTRLAEGQDTHCGMVIEVKPQLVKVQTVVGERWFRRDQLFRPYDNRPCHFINGVYSGIM